MLRWAFLALLLIGEGAQAATLQIVNGLGSADFLNGVRDANNAFSQRSTLCDGTNPDVCAPVSATLGLTVTLANSSALTTNLTQVNGAGIALGHATMANSLPVTIASDQTTLPVSGNFGLAPQVSGGLLTSSIIAANNITATVIVTGQHQVFNIDGYSIHATQPVWVKLYDATSQTCATGTPKWRVLVPASGATAGSGAIPNYPNGLAFSTGIVMCVTQGIADNDNVAPAASSYVINVGYK